MAKRMFTGNGRQPTPAESAAASEAAFGPPKAKRDPDAKQDARERRARRPSASTPMTKQVQKIERQTAMY